MQPPTDELYSLLVPLYQHRLIVPRACVAEVLRHMLEPPADGAPAWLRGLLRWNERLVPVISFEQLTGLPSAEPGGRTRIAVMNVLSDRLPVPAYGLLTEGFPQLVRVNRDVIEPDTRHAWPADGLPGRRTGIAGSPARPGAPFPCAGSAVRARLP